MSITKPKHKLNQNKLIIITISYKDYKKENAEEEEEQQ